MLVNVMHTVVYSKHSFCQIVLYGATVIVRYSTPKTPIIIFDYKFKVSVMKQSYNRCMMWSIVKYDVL